MRLLASVLRQLARGTTFSSCPRRDGTQPRFTSRRPARPVDAARESARDQFEEEQAAQRRTHLLIFSAPSVIILAHRRRRRSWLLMMGMVSGDNRVGDEVYRCLLPISWHDNHT